MQKRVTNQQLIILDFLREDKTHPTAEGVYLAVQKKLPRISKATVYRILDNLVKEGVVRKIKDGKKTGSPARFDGNSQAHQHFICDNCGKIIDIYDEKIEKYLNNKKATVQNGRVEGFNLNFRGQCENCLR